MYCLLVEEKEKERKEELFRDYVGQCLWHITTIQHFKTNEENTMPQYVVLSHQEIEPPKMTAQEIKDHILEKLGC